jgi:hypothetical protein
LNIVEDKTEQIPSRQRDGFAVGHFFVWLVFGTVFYLGQALDRLWGLYLLLVPLLVIAALIASGAFVIGVVANLWARRWRRLVSVVAAPVVTIGLLAASLHYQLDPDWLHFQLTRNQYTELARDLPGPSPKYHEWDWGGTGGAGGPNMFYSLVYDETDNPLNRPEQPGHQEATFSAQPYGHHFFLVTETFQ